MLVNRSNASLLIVDIQEKLFSKINCNETILKHILILLESFSKLKLPVIYTEQYPSGLGTTIPQIKEYFEESESTFNKFEKTTFSCFPFEEYKEKNKYITTNQVLIVGIEAINTFNLKIYNRWGVKIYEINSPFESWDGFYNGKVSDSGVYNFHLDFSFGSGKKGSRQGTITLIR